MREIHAIWPWALEWPGIVLLELVQEVSGQEVAEDQVVAEVAAVVVVAERLPAEDVEVEEDVVEVVAVVGAVEAAAHNLLLKFENC